MRDKKIVNTVFLCKLNLRKLGILYFVPPAVLFLLIPFMGFGYLSYHGFGENAIYLIFCDFQKFVPFMGAWWVLFSLSDYAEGKAAELLRVYKKSMLADFLLLFLWYILHVIVLFLAFGIFIDNYWMDFMLVFIQTALFASVAFFLLFAAKAMLVPFLVILFYEIFAILSNFSVMEYINIFSLQRIETFSQLLWPYIPLLAASVILVLLGNKLYKRRK